MASKFGGVAAGQSKFGGVDPNAPPPGVQVDPLQEQAQGTGVFQAATIAAGEGMVNFLRGVGFMDPATGIEKESFTALQEESPIATGIGGAIGEAAIPTAAAVLTGGVGGLAAQIPIQAGIGAAEAGIIARGRGQDVLTATGVGGTIAGVSEALIPVVGRLGGALFRKIRGRAPAAPLIDAAGNASKEFTDALDEAGIGLADVVQEAQKQSGVSQEAVAETAEQVGAAATKKIGKQKASAALAEEIQPSADIISAADKLGLKEQLLPSHTSQNPVFIAVEQGLKSVPGSQLAVQEKKVITELAQKADDFIIEFGGGIDKSSVSEVFRTEATGLVEGLEKQAEKAYRAVGAKIPRNAPVTTDAIISTIQAEAKALGGEEFLDSSERALLKAMDPKTNPTYGRIDKLRRDIGDGLNGRGRFKDSTEADLSRLYGALAQDQKTAAAAHGAGSLYETATSLVVSRKAIEDQLVKVLGRDAAGSIVTKARPAILNLQKGETKEFVQLLANIPEAMGDKTKRGVVITALNDAFTQGSREAKSLSVPAFDDFMSGINRNKGARLKLADAIGKKAMARLDLLHTVVGGVRRAQKEAITTGRIAAVPGILDEQKGLTARLFGLAAKVGVAEGATTSAGLPGVGATGIIVSALRASKTPRSEAADKLLSSPTFAEVIRKTVAGRLDTEAKRKGAERAVVSLAAYKKWIKTLPADEARKAATLGAVAYLSGQDSGEQNE